MPGLPVPNKYLRNYQSIPQNGLNGRTSIVYSAAVVGGGTVVNAMFFNRGSKADWDSWEHLGNPGWNWEGLLPYFKKVRLSICRYCSTTDSHRGKGDDLHPAYSGNCG